MSKKKNEHLTRLANYFRLSLMGLLCFAAASSLGHASDFSYEYIGTYTVNYRYNAGGQYTSMSNPDYSLLNPYYGTFISPGPIFINANPGRYQLVVVSGTGCCAWSGDATGGTFLAAGKNQGDIVELDHLYGQIALYFWDWYPWDNDPNNQTTISVYRIVENPVLDTTPPVITCPADMIVPWSVDLLVPVTFLVTATDDIDPSPIVSCTPQSGSGFPVGTTTVVCTATDASGNESTCSFTITRLALGFSGFLPPIGGSDASGGSFASPLRTFKMGSTIPIKFTASCGDSAVVTGVHTLQVIKYTDATKAGFPVDATPQDTATTGNEFRLTDGQWKFNLDTKNTGMSTGIWLFVATLSDGTQHIVWLQLK